MAKSKAKSFILRLIILAVVGYVVGAALAYFVDNEVKGDIVKCLTIDWAYFGAAAGAGLGSGLGVAGAGLGSGLGADVNPALGKELVTALVPGPGAGLGAEAVFC